VKSDTSLANTEQFRLTSEERLKIDNVMGELGLDLSAEQVFSFFKLAIKSREFCKFEFTKNVSKAIDLAVIFARRCNIGRNDLSYLSLDDLVRFCNGATDTAYLEKMISVRKNEHQLTHLVELPPVLCNKNDLECFERFSSIPNFITRGRATGRIVEIAPGEFEHMEGKIALIHSADPGFDWIFGEQIAGLITRYGGANSHMAIRAAEIGLPAAIGVGDKLFTALKAMSCVELNCAVQIIREVP